MKRSIKQFLLLSYLASILCFGLPLYLGWDFRQMLSVGWPLFILGGLGPALAAALLFFLRREELGGLPGLLDRVRRCDNPRSWLLVPVFLVLHFGLAALLGVVRLHDSPAQYLGYAPLAFFLFGSQELGWCLIVQDGLEEILPLWKATAATGLFASLWFLPLLMMEGFLVPPDHFLHFAVYLVGLRFLLSAFRRKGAGVLACCVFSGVFFALAVPLSLYMGGLFFAVPVLDAAICFLYSSRLVKENL